MNSGRLTFIGIASAVALLVAANAFFIVKENEMALRLRLGEIVYADYDPGLRWKWPFFESVQFFDKRIQTLDTQPQRFLTLEKKFVVVDSYVKWRISDLAQYYRSTRGSVDTASRLLSERINSALRDEFGKRTIQEVISGERAEIMTELTKQADTKANDLGVEVVDVRVKQIDFPTEVSQRVYERMRTERERVARELRAQGAEAAEGIRADADRQRTEILAEAYREAEEIRGEGDAKAAEVYANAFNRDPEFYAFWRSLKAYRDVFESGGSLMVLDPNSEFFRYFIDKGGR
jgi:membrane protease subunit HflC